MTAWSTQFVPKTLRFCRLCGKETPHELREGSGMVVTVCVGCVERAMTYELDRE